MASIVYRPTTQGQAFGDPTRLFQGAASSLGKATTGLSSAFDTYRQGQVEAKDRRTQDAISAIQGARTPEEYQQLASQLSAPGAIPEQYGDVNVSDVAGALREQEGVARQTALDNLMYQQQLGTAQDIPILQQAEAGLGGKSVAELQSLDRNLPGVSDPSAYGKLLDAAIARQQGVESTATSQASKKGASDLYIEFSNAGNRDPEQFIAEGLTRGIKLEDLTSVISGIQKGTGAGEDIKEGRKRETRRIDQARKDLEVTLSKLDTTDDLLGVLDSSRQEADKDVLKLKQLGIDPELINDLISAATDGNDYEPSIIKNFLKKLPGATPESPPRQDIDLVNPFNLQLID